MKKTIYILIAILSLSSCDKWLDVNDNPNSGTELMPSPDQRLPSIIAQFMDCYESSGTRTSLLTQQLSCVYALNNNWYFTAWRSTAGSAAWPWQAWYVNTGVNIDPLIAAAEKVEAYHYIGAAKIIKAVGFATMVDLYGIAPYQQAFNPLIANPAFDDGEYIYGQVFSLLDDAITELQKVQTNTAAPALKKGDPLNGGDVNKWIKLAYGLKARYMNHLSKKSSLYKPTEILAALANSPQTVSESSIMQYVDEGANNKDASKEALQYTNTSTTVRFTKLYIDYLTNTYPGVPAAASGIEDPRVDIIIPSSQGSNGVMYRSQGVDMSSNVPNVGPSAYTYDNKTKKYVTSNTSRPGDTVYVQMRKLTDSGDGRIVSTGSWYTQRGGKCLFVTAAEMKFIEAEVKFKQGDVGGALTAYQAGIQAHMDMLGVPSSASATYLSSAAVAQTPGQLTMSLIMIQKYIAMSFSPEVFADVRRHNYCTNAAGIYDLTTGVYKGLNRPSNVYTLSYPNATDLPRRFAMASYEVNYNTNQLLAKDPDATKDTYIAKPVWWDQP